MKKIISSLLISLSLFADISSIENLIAQGKYKDASILLTKECDERKMRSCMTLGYLYELGTEDNQAQQLQRDEIKAKKLYEKACKGNIKQACKMKNELQKSMVQKFYFKEAQKDFIEDGIFKGQGGVRIYKYKNGNIKALVPYVNEKVHGIVYEFWENKEIKSKIHMKIGANHGLEEKFYKMGELIYEAQWANGTRINAKTYYVNGNLMSEVNYTNGKAINGYNYTQDGIKTKITSAHIHNMNKPKF